MAEKSLSALGLELVTLRSALWLQATFLSCIFPADPAPWYSCWAVGLLEVVAIFYGQGMNLANSREYPSKQHWPHC